MSTIFELKLFACVARHASLSAAARTLDVSTAAVSFGLKRLEERLQTRLFARTTRNMRLTEDGARYLVYVESALELLDRGESTLLQQLDEVTGVVHITAPCDLSRHMLLPCLAELREHYPKLNIHLLVSDRPRDLFLQPVDLALRFGIPKASELVALPVWEKNYRVACASPAYVKHHGAITRPEELSERNCITFQLSGTHYDSWTFSSDEETVKIKARGDYRCDDSEVVKRWALDGRGVIFKSWLDVAADIKSGRLCHLLPEWRGENVPLYLMIRHQSQATNAVKVLHSLLKEKCKLIAGESES